MSPVLLELVLRSLVGRVRRWLRLLRTPRYLVAFVVGVVYFGWMIVRPWLMGATGPPGGALAQLLPQLQGLLALALALAATLTWLLLPGRAALHLSSAELEILAPAPLPRRDIIAYALLKEQPAILFGAVLVGLGRPALLPWAWAVLTLASLHVKVCALTKARLRERPTARAWVVRLLVLAGLVAYWAALIGGVRHAWWLNVAATTGGGAAPVGLLPAVARAFTAPGVGRLLLLPFLLITAPLAAPAGGMLLAGWAALLVLLGLHMVWVVHTQVRFEEATLERARRRAASRDPRARHTRITPAGRRLVPFRLLPEGRAATAVLWKSLVQVARWPLGRVVAGVATLVVGAGAAAAVIPQAEVVLAVLVPMAAVLAMLALFAPLSLRADLRLDLTRLELVRTWPVPAWQVVLADLLVPALVGWIAAAAAAGVVTAADAALRLSGGGPSRELTHGLIPVQLLPLPGVPEAAVVPLAALAGLIVLAALVALHAAAVNLAVVLLPGWIPLGHERPRGPAAFGQSVIAGGGMMLVLLVGLLPAGLLVGVVVAGQAFAGLVLPVWELPLLGLIAALPLLAEAGGAVWLAGWRLARLDPTADLLDAT